MDPARLPVRSRGRPLRAGAKKRPLPFTVLVATKGQHDLQVHGLASVQAVTEVAMSPMERAQLAARGYTSAEPPERGHCLTLHVEPVHAFAQPVAVSFQECQSINSVAKLKWSVFHRVLGQLCQQQPELANLGTDAPHVLFFSNVWCARAVSAPALLVADLQVLSLEEFLAQTTLLHAVAHSVGTWMRWLEGCHCHSDLLASCTSWTERQKALEQAGVPGGRCVWAGRRGVELVLGGVDRILHSIRHACSSVWAELRERAQSIQVADLSECAERLASAVCGELESKLTAMWKNFPYILLGCFGEYHGFSLSTVASFAKELLQKYEQVRDKPLLHRVVAYYLESPRHKVALHQLASGVSLKAFPNTSRELFGHASSHLCNRRNEGDHSAIAHTKRATHHYQASYLMSRQRRHEVERAANDYAFLCFAEKVWDAKRENSVYHQLLAHTLPAWKIYDLQFEDKVRHIYGLNHEVHFEDAGIAAQEISTFICDQPAPARIVLTPAERLILEACSAMLPIGIVVSVPRWAFNVCEGVGSISATDIADSCQDVTVAGFETAAEWAFVEVLDNRPAEKTVVELPHLTRQTGMIRCQPMCHSGDMVRF